MRKVFSVIFGQAWIALALSVGLLAFQARPGYFTTITGTSTSATALTLAGGVTAGSGAVGIIGTTGKIPALTATYFTSLDASALTTINASNIASGTLSASRLPATVIGTTSFNTSTGSTGSIGNGVTTTIFSATAVGLYLVEAWIDNAGSQYLASARVMSDGTNTRITSDDGVNMTITLSGNNVQVTQTSGTDATVQYVYMRLR